MASTSEPSSPSSLPLAPAGQGLRLMVRLTPKASRNKIDGCVPNAAGETELKVSVTAVPEGGKANAALIRLLSKEWKIAKSNFDIIAGHTDRHKVLMIASPTPQEDARRLQTLIEEKN